MKKDYVHVEKKEPDRPFDWQDSVVLWGCITALMWVIIILTE